MWTLSGTGAIRKVSFPSSHPHWLFCPALIYQNIHFLHWFEMLPSSNTKFLKYTWLISGHYTAPLCEYCSNSCYSKKMSSLLFQNRLIHSLYQMKQLQFVKLQRRVAVAGLGGGIMAWKAWGELLGHWHCLFSWVVATKAVFGCEKISSLHIFLDVVFFNKYSKNDLLEFKNLFLMYLDLTKSLDQLSLTDITS